jgi:hypothetical protein
MAELERRRRDLERQVEDLRAFEREYRTRLKAYLETQLRELSGRGVAADGPTSPPPAAEASPPAPTRAPPAGAPPVPSAAPPAAPAGRPASPFGPAPTFGREASSTGSAPAPTGPPREADGPDAPDADAPAGMEVDQGPEVPPSAG